MGSRGGGSGKGGKSGGGGGSALKNKSATSTGGKLVDQGGGQLYGENDNGYSASVLDGGKDNYNLYKYGSKQIYEVKTHKPDGTQDGSTRIFTTKTDARKAATEYLQSHK